VYYWNHSDSAFGHTHSSDFECSAKSANALAKLPGFLLAIFLAVITERAQESHQEDSNWITLWRGLFFFYIIAYRLLWFFLGYYTFTRRVIDKQANALLPATA
jgi:hypothetical protein